MGKMKLVFRGEMLRLGIKEGSDKSALCKFAESIQFHHFRHHIFTFDFFKACGAFKEGV